MSRYLAARLVSMIPVVFLVTLMVFVLGHLIPGDPVLQLIPSEEAGRLTPKDLGGMRAAYGLDRPLPVQYVDWLGRVLRGDLGRSLRTRKPVLDLILQRLPVTAEVAFFAMLLSLSAAIPLGIRAALRSGTAEDTAVSIIGLVGLSTPHIFIASVLIFVFSYTLNLLPAGGYTPPFADPGRNLVMMLMPAFTLGTGLMGSVMRITRTSVVEVLRTEYITAARAKGVVERRVLYRHALKNAFIPVTTVIGLQIGALLGGAFISETIFAIPGVGRLAIGSIFARDFPVVQGVVMFVALLYLVINLVVDLVYAWLDPRIRFD